MKIKTQFGQRNGNKDNVNESFLAKLKLSKTNDNKYGS